MAGSRWQSSRSMRLIRQRLLNRKANKQKCRIWFGFALRVLLKFLFEVSCDWLEEKLQKNFYCKEKKRIEMEMTMSPLYNCRLRTLLLSTVSVKIVGTLLCLLVPSMLVYKVWWLNRNKQLWEGQGEHEEKKTTAFGQSVPTIFVWDCRLMYD